MYQKTIIVGRLTSDPELRYTTTREPVPVTRFSVAVNHQRKNEAGQAYKETAWFTVLAFGSLAEVCEKNLKKGRLVLVEGTLLFDLISGNPPLYPARGGTTRSAFELKAVVIKFLSSDNDLAMLPPAQENEFYTQGELPNG